MTIRLISRSALFATALCLAQAVAAPLDTTRTETFDYGWKFDRFGKMPDGSIRPEPGQASPATASSTEGENKAAFAIDGDNSSRWCAADASPNQTLSIDYGRPIAVKKVEILWEKQANHQFKLEGSPDGRRWTVIADKTSGPNDSTSDTVEITGKPRHFRLTVTGTGGANWASVREFKAMDDKGQDIRPLPVNDKKNPALFAPNFNDSSWRSLNLPHDWGVEGPFRMDIENETGKLPWAGIGWYRKNFSVPADARGNQFYLDFDGIMSRPKVYVNGQLAGEWKYGYTPFRVDITPFLQFGKNNVIAVRVDNPTNSSRWYPGGGIHRHVWLTESNPVHIDYHGVFVRTPEISTEKATVAIDTTVSNTADKPVAPTVLEQIIDKDGKVVASAETKGAEIAPGQTGIVASTLSLPHPKMWDMDTPNLYTARSTVKLDGKTVDIKDTSFGVRTVEWKPEGFFLNGRRVQLNGVCQHGDLGPLGTAVHTRGYERQVEILKEMGVNSIRTSHNPPAPELLDICDKNGILVIDELFDMWKQAKKGNDYHNYFPEWHEKDLIAFCRRDRNHPSVILWSTGNEVPEQGNKENHYVSQMLTDLFHREDPTRLVTAGCNDAGAAHNGFSDTMDVYGFNYKPWGQYAEFRAKRPNQPFYASETSSCVSTRGAYYFPEEKDFWDKSKGFYEFQVSSYDLYAPGWAYRPDIEFKAQEDDGHSAGEYVWTGFDYLGEPTPYNLDTTNALNFKDPAERAKYMEDLKKLGNRAPSRSSYFGIVDLCGFKKDRFYIYQAHWKPDHKMAHILPHWNWNGKDNNRVGKVTPVHVYTSGDTAELFLNGKSLGVKKKGMGDKDRYRLVWEDVIYQPGELKVVVTKDGKPWAKDVVTTTGPATHLTVNADRTEIAGDGRDLSYVTLTVRDAKGRMVPTAKDQLYFKIDGPAEIVAVCNGDPTDFDSFQKPQIKAFNGLAQVIVRSKRGESGKATLQAVGEGFKPVQTVLTVTPATPEQLKK